MIVVMLALLSIARMQKRDLAVIHFSGPDDLRFDLFPKGEVTPAEVIACASFFFNGGTVFEPSMEKALEAAAASPALIRTPLHPDPDSLERRPFLPSTQTAGTGLRSSSSQRSSSNPQRE